MAATSSRWSWRRFRSSAALAAAVALATVLPGPAAPQARHAQAPAGQAASPQFRSRVDLVEIDVTVLDRNNQPVTTLTAADFEVRERGELQRIDTIALVTGDPTLLARGRTRSAEPAGADASGDPAAAAIVRPLPPRVFIFVLDMTHLSAAGFTRSRNAIRGFVEDGLRPGDLVGLVVEGKMLGNRIESDKSLLSKQLESVGSPNLSRYNERRQWPRILSEEEAVAIARNNTTARDAAVARACEERPGDCRGNGRDAVEAEIDGKSRLMASEAVRDGETTLNVLMTLASGLGRFPGPKHVIFFSEGFYTGEFLERVTQVAGLSARNRVRISTLDARGLGTDPRQQDLFGAAPVLGTGDFAVLGADANADVLTTLALETGGQRVRNRNNLGPALDAIATETGTYYLIGYSSTKPFDGSYRTISVRVRQPALTVRARRGYLALQADTTTIDDRPSASDAIGNRQAGIDKAAPAPAALPPATTTPPTAVPPRGAPAAAAADPNALVLRPDATLSRNAEAVASRLAEPTSAASARAATLAREGWDRYAKGDVEGARERLAAAVEAGGSLWVRYALGISELALKNVDGARTAFEAVRKGEPAFKGVYFDLADVYLQLGRSSEALSVLRDASRRWPDDADTHNAVGVVLLRRDAVDDAVESFSRAVAAAPNDGVGYYNLGMAHHLRYQRWLRSSSTAPAVTALAERARLSALEAYRKCVTLGGPFEAQARKAMAMIERSP